MSTTFDVIPVETADITFGQVKLKAEGYINFYLRSIGIPKSISLNIDICDNYEKWKINRVQSYDRFEWKEFEYLWITIDNIKGGTDVDCSAVYSKDIEPENPWWMLDYWEENNKNIVNIEEKLSKSKFLNRRWNFRRSIGQPGIMVLSYGLIAAAVAELTGGIIWSNDGALDSYRPPLESQDFIDFYFRPEKTSDSDYKFFINNCIESIFEELKV